MARSRQIKPEFFEDLKIAEVSVDARYLYIGLWTHMDRQGVCDGDARYIKRAIFPYDDAITLARVKELVAELVRAQRVVGFAYEGREYLYSPTFARHQTFHHREEIRFALPSSVLEDLARANPGLALAEPGQALAEPGPDLGQAQLAVGTAVTTSISVLSINNKSKARAKDEPNPALFDQGTAAMLARIKRSTQDAWLSLYKPEFIREEIKRAEIWCSANPERAPRSRWGTFMSSWLSRSWERARKNLPTTKGVAAINTSPLNLGDL